MANCESSQHRFACAQGYHFAQPTNWRILRRSPISLGTMLGWPSHVLMWIRMGFSLLGKIVKVWPRKRKQLASSKSVKAEIVNAETPRPTKEKQNMKVRTQIVNVVGGVALLGRLGA